VAARPEKTKFRSENWEQMCFKLSYFTKIIK